MKSIQERVIALCELYKKGLIPTLAEHEVHPDVAPDSRECYLYFTLPPCLNFQRNSPAMWKSALLTWNDPETNYLFFPEKTADVSIDKIRADLLKYKLALQPNKHIDIWTRISSTLHEHFENDPRLVLKAGENDAVKILTLVQQERKVWFPYLSGPKMANYWLYILSRYTDMHLENMDAISIIPDTHVLQCSAHLGIALPSDTSVAVALKWKELLSGTGIFPIEMHPVLWNWSRNNFQPEV